MKCSIYISRGVIRFAPRQAIITFQHRISLSSYKPREIQNKNPGSNDDSKIDQIDPRIGSQWHFRYSHVPAIYTCAFKSESDILLMNF